jgi:hypothetical protein
VGKVAANGGKFCLKLVQKILFFILGLSLLFQDFLVLGLLLLEVLFDLEIGGIGCFQGLLSVVTELVDELQALDRLRLDLGVLLLHGVQVSREVLQLVVQKGPQELDILPLVGVSGENRCDLLFSDSLAVRNHRPLNLRIVVRR